MQHPIDCISDAILRRHKKHVFYIDGIGCGPSDTGVRFEVVKASVLIEDGKSVTEGRRRRLREANLVVGTMAFRKTAAQRGLRSGERHRVDYRPRILCLPRVGDAIAILINWETGIGVKPEGNPTVSVGLLHVNRALPTGGLTSATTSTSNAGPPQSLLPHASAPSPQSPARSPLPALAIPQAHGC